MYKKYSNLTVKTPFYNKRKIIKLLTFYSIRIFNFKTAKKYLSHKRLEIQ